MKGTETGTQVGVNGGRRNKTEGREHIKGAVRGAKVLGFGIDYKGERKGKGKA